MIWFTIFVLIFNICALIFVIVLSKRSIKKLKRAQAGLEEAKEKLDNMIKSLESKAGVSVSPELIDSISARPIPLGALQAWNEMSDEEEEEDGIS